MPECNDPSDGGGPVFLAELKITKFLGPDGSIQVYDASCDNSGEEIDPSVALELIEWARASVLAPMVWSMMRQFDEEDEDEEADG